MILKWYHYIMKLITKNTDYAIKALCYMAKHNSHVITVKEMVNKLRIPRAYLRRILQILHKRGFLKAYKGKGGGFILNRKPGEIHVKSLITVFQGRVKLSECIFKKRICPDIKTCQLKKKIAEIESYLIAKLESITIANLVNKKG